MHRKLKIRDIDSPKDKIIGYRNPKVKHENAKKIKKNKRKFDFQSKKMKC